MTAQRGSKGRNLAVKPEKETTASGEITKAEAKTAPFRAEVKKIARPKSIEAPAATRKDVKAAQAKVTHERQAPIVTEQALAEDRETLTDASLEIKQEPQPQWKRVSFVVRLTVDEHSQVRRTEIEHVESGGKQNLLSLDGEGLVAFMKASIGPADVPEHTIPPAPPPETVEVATVELHGPKSGLSISDVRVFRPELSDVMALILNSEEAFVVEARFHLQGSAVPSLGVQDSPYEMKVYVSEVTSGKSKLLTTCSAILTQDELEYTVQAEAPRLPPGIYRLFTHVSLGAPNRLAGHHDGPVIRVI